MLFRALFVSLSLVAVSVAVSGQTIVRTPTQLVRNDPNWPNQGGFGRTVLGLEDFNGDGFSDYAVCAPGYPVGTGVGRVYLYSGRTGEIFQFFDGSQANAGFGLTMADVGDVNNDGTRDLAIGSPEYDLPSAGAAGRVQVFSGASGLELWSLDGTVATGNLGTQLSVSGIGPGPRALIATEPDWSSPTAVRAGRVVFIDSSSGLITGWSAGTIAFGSLGTGLAAGPGVSGIYAYDGSGDVYSIAMGIGGSGTVTLMYPVPPTAGGFPAITVLAGTMPGTSRIAVAHQTADSNGFFNNGVVNVYLEGSITPALTLNGTRSNEFFGQRLARVLDFDGNGEEELLVLTSGPFAASPNQVRIYSQSGAVIDEAMRAGANGSSFSSISDVTGDGCGEWLNGIGTGSTTTFECAMFSRGLSGSVSVTGAGSLMGFTLDATSAFAGGAYVQGYGFSGFSPGIVGPSPWPLIALNFDELTTLAYMIAGTSTLPNPIGTLDGAGTQSTTLFLPTASVASLGINNTRFTTTFIVVTPGGDVGFASNPTSIQF